MDAHCEAILQEYRNNKQTYDDIRRIVLDVLEKNIAKEGIQYANISSRVKTEDSLAGKLDLKGYKYKSIFDITDICGARISTLYIDEVDLVAALVERLFTIDWENSIDKRALLESDRFGYMSIHYICSIPAELFHDEKRPELNEIRFEIQVRTELQDIWATINHDLGYKSDVEIPTVYKRTISRLAGLLELADEEFKRFRRGISEYRNQVLTLVQDGKFDDISYNIDSFTDYIAIDPFKDLNESIASALKADITPANMLPYYDIFLEFGVKTLGDIERFKNEYSEDAKRFALHRMAGLELNIMSTTVGIQNLCIVFILKQGYGEVGIKLLYDALFGPGGDNTRRAKRTVQQAIDTNIIEG